MAPESKLAVILHADIVGSTAQVQIDERIAHRRFQEAFERLSIVIDNHGGQTHEVRGDALVAEFARASDAIVAAVEFQATNQEAIEQLEDEIRPHVRLGIALGEVVIADNTLTGSGVVLAQRLEQLTPPGGVYISAAIREAVPGRLGFAYQDLGEHQLKGFEQRQRAYVVASSSRVDQDNASKVRENTPSLGLQRTSIAVLPLANMSSDPEQEFFADGMTEDITTALSKFHELVVIARNSTSAYKGQSIGPVAAANDLGVRYIVEGSLRKAGNRVRLSVQLVDSESANHVWAERYDRVLEDVFEVQDELSAAVVSAIAPSLTNAEIARVRGCHPANLNAWGCYQLGMAAHGPQREQLERSYELMKQATTLDPEFSSAFAWLGLNAYFRALGGNPADRQDTLAAGRVNAERAISLDRSNAMGYVAHSRILGMTGERDASERQARLAIELNPNLWWARQSLAWCFYHVMGEPERAVAAFEEAIVRNPRDPMRWSAEMMMGASYRAMGDFEEASRLGEISCEGGRGHLPFMHLAATRALAGDVDQSKALLDTARRRQPSLSLSAVRSGFLQMHERSKSPLLDGLALAGLPD